MRSTRRLSFALLLALPALAQANCYSVYDTQNHLSFQSSVAPIDLSRRISEAMAGRFPGGHLVISPDMTNCREIRASTEPVRPRPAPGQPSPMLTNVPGASGDVDSESMTPSARRTRQRR